LSLSYPALCKALVSGNGRADGELQLANAPSTTREHPRKKIKIQNSEQDFYETCIVFAPL
jgi:hypothetical protein